MSIIIHEDQIIAVVQYMASQVYRTKNFLSQCGARDAIARDITAQNLAAYRATSLDPQRHNVADTGLLKPNFDFSKYQPISTVQCLKYIETIVYNSLESPNWEKSQAKEMLNFWHSCLISKIFNSAEHLAPTASSKDQEFYTERWISGLTTAVKASDDYLNAKRYIYDN